MNDKAQLASKWRGKRLGKRSKFYHYRPSFARRFFTLFLRAAFKVTMRLEISGLENLPKQGGYIVMINHISFLDPVIISGKFPHPVISMAKIEAYEDWFTGPLIRVFDAFPVNRGDVDRVALQTAFDVLGNGLPLLIAPEGTRSATTELGEPHQGLAYIASRTGAPIVPVAISGSHLWKINIKRLRRTWVRLRIGTPFYLDAARSRANTAVLRKMTDEAMYYMASLLPAEQRGIYSDLNNATREYLRLQKEEGE